MVIAIEKTDRKSAASLHRIACLVPLVPIFWQPLAIGMPNQTT
jgi:hypothetical protein